MTGEGRWEIVRSDSGWRARYWRSSDIICWTEDYARCEGALDAIESVTGHSLVAMMDTPTSPTCYRLNGHGRPVRMTDDRTEVLDPVEIEGEPT